MLPFTKKATEPVAPIGATAAERLVVPPNTDAVAVTPETVVETALVYSAVQLSLPLAFDPATQIAAVVRVSTFAPFPLVQSAKLVAPTVVGAVSLIDSLVPIDGEIAVGAPVLLAVTFPLDAGAPVQFAVLNLV